MSMPTARLSESTTLDPQSGNPPTVNTDIDLALGATTGFDGVISAVRAVGQMNLKTVTAFLIKNSEFNFANSIQSFVTRGNRIAPGQNSVNGLVRVIEVRHQHFDHDPGIAGADGHDGLSEMLRAAEIMRHGDFGYAPSGREVYCRSQDATPWMSCGGRC